jgi:hypothetical protein
MTDIAKAETLKDRARLVGDAQKSGVAARMRSWRNQLGDYLMIDFGMFATIVSMENEPPEWVEETVLDQEQESRMSRTQLAKVESQNAIVKDWRSKKMSMTGAILGQMDERAIKRVVDVDDAGWNRAKRDGNVPALLKLIVQAHTFGSGSEDASVDEKKVARNALEAFVVGRTEGVGEASSRFRELDAYLDKCDPDEKMSAGKKMYWYCKGFARHGTPIIKNDAVAKAASLNFKSNAYLKDPANAAQFDLAIYQRLLEQMEHTASAVDHIGGSGGTAAETVDSKAVITGDTRPVALTATAGKIARKLKAGGTAAAATTEEGTVGPETERVVQRLMRKHKKTRAELLELIVCFDCCKKGHVRQDCPDGLGAKAVDDTTTVKPTNTALYGDSGWPAFEWDVEDEQDHFDH